MLYLPEEIISRARSIVDCEGNPALAAFNVKPGGSLIKLGGSLKTDLEQRSPALILPNTV